MDAIESIYNVLIEKNVDMVSFSCYINDSYESNTDKKWNLCGLEGKLFSTSQSDFVKQISIRVLKGDLPCAVWSFMIRKDILLKTSLFALGIHYAEDCILYNELLDKIDTIYFLDKTVYHYYQNPTSCTKSSKYYLQNIYSSARAYEKLVNIIEKDKFEKKSRTEATTDRFGKIIMDLIYLIYLDKQRTNKKFMQLLKEMMKDDTIQLIIKNTNADALELHISLPFKWFAKEKYKTLVLFYNFRKFCRDFRNKIKK